jgi:hypothetical protein
VAGFARALAVASVASALQAGVEADPAAGARLRRLKALLDHHSGTPQAKQALVAAIGDRDPEVCLLAAQHQGGRAPPRPWRGSSWTRRCPRSAARTPSSCSS